MSANQTLYNYINKYIKFLILLICFEKCFWNYCFSEVSSNIQISSQTIKISEKSQKCITCHKYINPGLVVDWEKSAHAKISAKEANNKNLLNKKVSFIKIDKNISNFVVGCYECHGQNNQIIREDAFEHYGEKIHTIVSPIDCQTCHLVEVTQYKNSKKAYAFYNLKYNKFHTQLIDTIYKDYLFDKSSEFKLLNSCYDCHGKPIYASGTKKIESIIGIVEVPNLINWPNHGVGRVNPDSSMGSCTSCHPRHSFSISTARHPNTCSQCHTKPDAPAYNVYFESKHGNILLSNATGFNFTATPWQVGKHFTAPTCATCHISLVVDLNERVIAERTHDFGARLWIRIFGLIYAHPQPKSGNTFIIVNSENIQLPTNFNGELAQNYLISELEQNNRKLAFTNICLACHSKNFVENHFSNFEKNVYATNKSTYKVTKQLLNFYWINDNCKSNYFDSLIEKTWFRHWFYYSNSIRFSYAMSGATNFSSFHNGWYSLSESEDLLEKYIIELKNK